MEAIAYLIAKFSVKDPYLTFLLILIKRLSLLWKTASLYIAGLQGQEVTIR